MATTKERPICFIAMAFDHEDTDYLYEHQILPVLKRNGIEAVIINRQQSNDDLNIQIIEQLKRANFCITDLTYTRPSVYFEAGYAQAIMSDNVIYTVRKDHLHSGQPDNMRVHFDLQMKPLIIWKTHEDPTFAMRLEQRLKKTFLRSWNKAQQEKESDDETIRQFSAMSLDERLTALRYEILKMLKRQGVRKSDWFERAEDGINYGNHSKSSILEGKINFISGIQKNRNAAYFFSVQSFQSLTKRELQVISNKYSLYEIARSVISGPDLVYKDVFIISLKAASSHQILSVLNNYIPLQEPPRYYKEFSISPYPRKTDIVFRCTYYFLDNIKSLPHFHRELEDVEKQVAQHLRNP